MYYYSYLRKKPHQWVKIHLIKECSGGSQYCLQRISCFLPSKKFQIPLFTFSFYQSYPNTLSLYQSSLHFYHSMLHSFSLQTHHIFCIFCITRFPILQQVVHVPPYCCSIDRSTMTHISLCLAQQLPSHIDTTFSQNIKDILSQKPQKIIQSREIIFFPLVFFSTCPHFF